MQDGPPQGEGSRSYDQGRVGSSSALYGMALVSSAVSSFRDLAKEKKIMAKATEIPFEGIDSHPMIGIASR